MGNFLLRKLAAALVLLVVAASSPAHAATRVALVIGESAYAHVQRLPNPASDARMIADTLTKAGFEVQPLQPDMTRRQMQDALDAFTRKARAADVAVIYYAGHGIEVGGANYLIPVDAVLAEAEDISLEAVPLTDAVRAVRAKTLGLVLLDACRDNPFPAKILANTPVQRSVTRGLARVEPEGNTIVFYAAKDGTSALDGEGGHSPFAKSLSERLATPGMELHSLFGKVRQDVRIATNNQQTPFPYGVQEEDFYFVPGGATPVVQVATARPTANPALAGPQRSATQVTGLDAITAQEWNTLDDLGLLAAILSRATVATVNSRAARGEAAAQSAAGLITLYGYGGVTQDIPAAVRLFRAAAAQGDTFGQRALGGLMQKGMGGLQPDRAEAVRLLKLAADKGNIAAQTDLGTTYAQGLGGLPKDDREAVRLYRLAADQGSANAQANLGAMYSQGLGGLPKDEREAVRLYKLSADQRSHFGLTLLGGAYFSGIGGLAKDEKEGLRMFRMAAEQGDEAAQTWLGTAYANGLAGMPKDEREAVRLWSLAADRGYGEAQARLGGMYITGGGGLTVDLAKARSLYQMAADQGYQPAIDALRQSPTRR